MRALRALAALVLLVAAPVLAVDEPRAAAARESFEVFHNANPGEFTLRGELQLLDDDTARYQPVSVHDPPRLADTRGVPQSPAGYAVVLRSLKSGAQFVQPISRCRLHSDATAEETFVVHETEAGDVFRIDYDAGSHANCLKQNQGPFAPAAHTTALLRRRAAGPVPRLAGAARIDAATGKEQQPDAPKSFIAKYWYYLHTTHASPARHMDEEVEHGAAEAPSPPRPEIGEGKFDKMLNEAFRTIDGLMLVVITDAERTVVFREALTLFHQPRFEETLIDKCYDAFEDTKRLQIGVGNVLTLFYGAMSVVQFRVGSYYGTIVCDDFANMGMVHILVKRVRECLTVLVEISEEVIGRNN
ncbi:hypothetical protein LPJ61_000158 [Coemansia biformis]|uniref:Uncharacterized protein n=1 Tax=Coemansia biformis TaxID=1286918 RepID=A0A9W8CYD9_9FUNG|nr:hypothetical protein LPJ61_000158 [Coemansia biformis]